ncbi:hypothetical protein JNUCC42_16670 [Brevibacterium sp. JNUCC-42]|nr:hypothetical protein JNUCC42_16670 [Brevibacterium sp. JNUCC-42]
MPRKRKDPALITSGRTEGMSEKAIQRLHVLVSEFYVKYASQLCELYQDRKANTYELQQETIKSA